VSGSGSVADVCSSASGNDVSQPWPLSKLLPDLFQFLCAVWLGAGLGFLISLFFAAIFIAIYYSLDKEVFSGKSEMIFSGVISLIASVMITILAFGMLKMMALQDKWTRKLKKSATEVSVHHLPMQLKV
jgi:FTR1 family protein